MNGYRHSLRNTGMLPAAALCALAFTATTAFAQSGRVVEQAEYTSAYDAFMEMNRLRTELGEDEAAAEYWGALASRLGNQAGRNLVKRPASGFSEDAFRGWMIFNRAYGDNTGIGNCAACHRPPDFTDRAAHNVGTGQKEITTPSLREAYKKKTFLHDDRAKSLEEAIRIHVENGRIARQKKRELVDIEVGLIALTDDEIGQVAEFLRSLKPLEREAFREALIDVVVQPLDIDEIE